MAYTYSKIASYTVTAAGVNEVSFLAIPQNYTDLIIRYSARGNSGGNVYENVQVQFNSSGGTAYSDRNLYGTGSAAASAANSAQAQTYLQYQASGASTANTFGNTEIYIPNYTSSNYKSYSADSVGENNAAASITSLTAGLWSSTNSINSIKFTANTSTFLLYSTFTLYGVKAEV